LFFTEILQYGETKVLIEWVDGTENRRLYGLFTEDKPMGCYSCPLQWGFKSNRVLTQSPTITSLLELFFMVKFMQMVIHE
jgi:hypothetical protein